MTAKILAIDPRWRQPARIAFMREYLPEGCELIIPDSFESDQLVQEAQSARVILGGQAPLSAELMAAAPNMIEDYPEDKYGPSCLLLRFTSANRPLHI